MSCRNRYLKLATSLAAGATLALTAGAGSAQADVSNAAACSLGLHLAIHGGLYRSDASAVDCHGQLAGSLANEGGDIQAWGKVAQIASPATSGGCAMTWSGGVFAGRVRQLIVFLDPGYSSLVGGFEISSDASQTVSGSGEVDGRSFREKGTANFVPDPGQSCGKITSGTLTQTIALSDGGDGNPGAATQVQNYENSQSAGSPASGPADPSKSSTPDQRSAQQPAPRMSSRRAGHHRRRAIRRRTAGHGKSRGQGARRGHGGSRVG